jgi:glycerophosphoryl diester phosphodiesterase
VVFSQPPPYPTHSSLPPTLIQGTLDAGGNANELDCYTTADGEYVVIHDSRVDRTTNGTGVVRDYTLAELQELDAGWYKSNDGGSTYPFRGQGVKIQTLMEVFEEITEGLINIDIKESTEEAADLLAKVLDEVLRICDIFNFMSKKIMCFFVYRARLKGW